MGPFSTVIGAVDFGLPAGGPRPCPRLLLEKRRGSVSEPVLRTNAAERITALPRIRPQGPFEVAGQERGHKEWVAAAAVADPPGMP